MDSVDKLLEQIKAEYGQPQAAKTQPEKNAAKSFSPQPAKSSSIVDSLLAEVAADFAEQDEKEELRKQQKLEQERIRQAEIKAEQLKALKMQAEAWLKKLDPFSAEGLWFEKFAQTYPSKLDAAVEYLQSNQ